MDDLLYSFCLFLFIERITAENVRRNILSTNSGVYVHLYSRQMQVNVWCTTRCKAYSQIFLFIFDVYNSRMMKRETNLNYCISLIHNTNYDIEQEQRISYMRHLPRTLYIGSVVSKLLR